MGLLDVAAIVARALEFFWTLLIMALTGNMIHDAFSGNPSVINYCMFLAVISMLALFYLIPSTIKEDFRIHPHLPTGIDALMVLLFFAGAVAMAAQLHVNSCGDDVYLRDNPITNGSADMTKRCHEAQAVTAFLWFALIAYIVSLITDLIGGGRGMGGMRRSRV